jgi:hypothetical protein
MAHFTLEEKPRRRMKQPTKDYIRAELKLAEAEIQRKDEELALLRRPLWKRLLRKTA